MCGFDRLERRRGRQTAAGGQARFVADRDGDGVSLAGELHHLLEVRRTVGEQLLDLRVHRLGVRAGLADDASLGHRLLVLGQHRLGDKIAVGCLSIGITIGLASVMT